MMAKMFYTLDEAKAALGKNEEEIKQFAREGRLREFRDGPRLMFKADQVEALKAELGGGGSSQRDQVDLGVSDTGAPIGLVDSQRSRTGSGISLVDTDAGRGPGGTAMSGSGLGIGGLKDDTALAGDLGLAGSLGGSAVGGGSLSGSLGGVPSPGRSGMVSSGSGLSGSRGAINVLGESSAGADPGAQTAINASIGDQVNLEGVGSGSGLLDLTRESDDTSLGAELLDEIAPGGSRTGSRRGGSSAGSSGLEGTGGQSGTSAGSSISAAIPRRAASGPVIQVEAPDPMAGALGAACLAASVMTLLGAVAIFSAVLNTRPGLLEIPYLQKFLYLAGIGVILTVVFFIFGYFVGKPKTR